MPYSTSRRTRERRLRAYYRKKIWTIAIIMLVIGLVLGFVACVYSAKNNDRVADMLQLTAQKQSPYVTPTPAPIDDEADADALALFGGADDFAQDEVETTPEVIVAPTIAVVEVPAETAAPANSEIDNDESGVSTFASDPETDPTAISIVIPESIAATITEAPTEEPTALPTEEPTVEPTEAPTEEPTAEPTVEATVEPTVEVTAEPTVEVTAEPVAEATAEATVEATAEPTVEITAEPTPEPTVEPAAEAVVVPYGESVSFQTEILADGSARREATEGDSYETLDISMQVKAYKDPAYFEACYANDYNLQGNEAAVEFEITLNGYTGSTEIIPQNFLLITFCGEDESVTSQGFQLMDSEIAGNTEIAINSDQTVTLYKRYPYNAEQGDMQYMVVNSYVNGVEYTHRFEIIAPPDAEPTATPASMAELTVGTKGDEVKKLQAKLIDLGLLSGQPDGHFGNYTASAVKEMQRRFGMEETGVADQAFLNKLYE